MYLRAGLVMLLAVLLAVATACGDEEAPPETPAATEAPPGTVLPSPDGAPATPPLGRGPAEENLFRNPGFEDGEEPWFSLGTAAWGEPFRVSQDAARSGENSAALELAGEPATGGTKIIGVVQEIAPSEFPEVLSGYYRVSAWKRGAVSQYLQFVVIVWDAQNLPGNFPNHQIRYPLAGINQQPFAIGNGKFLFLGTDEPTPDGWVQFERNIRQDFQDLWGAVPAGFSKIRVLFEVRYDGKTGGDEARADVFYDDLYLGPAAGQP